MIRHSSYSERERGIKIMTTYNFNDFMDDLSKANEITYFSRNIEGVFAIEDYSFEGDYLVVYSDNSVVITLGTHPLTIERDEDDGWYFDYGELGDVSIACF